MEEGGGGGKGVNTFRCVSSKTNMDCQLAVSHCHRSDYGLRLECEHTKLFFSPVADTRG